MTELLKGRPVVSMLDCKGQGGHVGLLEGRARGLGPSYITLDQSLFLSLGSLTGLVVTSMKRGREGHMHWLEKR